MQSLTGKVAIVSGSSSGIGLAIANELSSRGAHVVLNYPVASLANETEAALASLPTPGLAVQADLSTVEGPDTLIRETVRHFERIDIVVNNAAVAVNLPFEEQTLAHWDSLVNLNARGTFLLTQGALPHLNHGTGRIINICSSSARRPPPLQTIYAGTKGMIDSFTKVWAKELPPKYGCTVNAVSPGPTATQGFLGAGEEAMRVLGPTLKKTPVEKRAAQPEEIAFTVAFLCEERARWVNGEHLHVNGGLFVD